MSGPLELTFLGTSAGMPTRDRNVTGLALRDGAGWDLFDCGEGTQHQLLATPLSLVRLERVFISHLHGDHCLGLFGLLGSRAVGGASAPLVVFGPEGLSELVRTVLDRTDTHLSYELELVEVPADGGAVVSGDVSYAAIPLDHRITSFAWLRTEAERPGVFDATRAQELGVAPGPDFGRLQRGHVVTTADGVVVQPEQVMGPPRPGRRLVIAGDNRDPASLVAAAGPLDLLVHEATFTEDVVELLGDDRGHSTGRRLGSAAEGVASTLAITHFSPRYGPPGAGGTSVDELMAEVRESYTGRLVVAQDLLTLMVDAAGGVEVGLRD